MSTDISGSVTITATAADLSANTVVLDIFRGTKKNRRIADIKIIIEEEYNDKDYIISTSLDILALYIKGQGTLYTEAKVYCEQQLNMLMLPAIFLSALCTVLSVSLKDLIAGVYIVSGLTAFNSFILSIISYLKLDAKAEAHKTSAYMYDKLGAVCEFNSGKIMFFKPEQRADGTNETRDKIMKLVEDVEDKITEIKDTNKFILPEVVRFRYKNLISQNLFSTVKRLQINDLVLKTELKSLLNKVDRLREEVDAGVTAKNDDLEEAIDAKEKKIIEIIQLRKEYIKLNDEFKKLIDEQIGNASRRCCWRCTRWLKT
jgi:hypothetical protein